MLRTVGENVTARHFPWTCSTQARLRVDMARAVLVLRDQRGSWAARQLTALLSAGPLGDLLREEWR